MFHCYFLCYFMSGWFCKRCLFSFPISWSTNSPHFQASLHEFIKVSCHCYIDFSLHAVSCLLTYSQLTCCLLLVYCILLLCTYDYELADEKLFRAIILDPDHALRWICEDKPNTGHYLHTRPHPLHFLPMIHGTLSLECYIKKSIRL